MTDDPFTIAQLSIARLANIQPGDIDIRTRISDLPIDSLDLFTVIADLEDAFNVSLPDDALGAMETIGDLAKFFQPKV